jgi:2-dehydropantoate 2-reductase
MKIAIIGAGAMGCLYGAKLSTVPENEVFLIDVWKEHVESINKNGLLVEEQGKLQTYNNIKAYTDANEIVPCDLVLVFVKSTHTGIAIKNNQGILRPNTIVLTLQNGLGNIDILSSEIGEEKVIAGTTAHGATMLGPGKIKHAGEGKTVIGELNGSSTTRIEMVASVLNKAGLDTDISSNVIGLVWDKLLVNVGINALTAITGLKNGELLAYDEIEEILEAAVWEAVQVAKEKGIKLGYTDPIAHTKQVCKATAENKSSMLQDLLHKRETEIEMINGAIVREGESLNHYTPVNKILTNLVKFMEKTMK